MKFAYQHVLHDSPVGRLVAVDEHECAKKHN